MTERLSVGEDEKYEDVRREFDVELGMTQWKTPAQQDRPEVHREPGTPLWWDSDEEASASFLKAQGVVLNG
jgi:hypothetical protein